MPRSKPNIVLILADLRCCGRKEHDTPNLDRLAGEGMRFASVLLRAADLFAVARGRPFRRPLEPRSVRRSPVSSPRELRNDAGLPVDPVNPVIADNRRYTGRPVC